MFLHNIQKECRYITTLWRFGNEFFFNKINSFFDLTTAFFAASI